MGFDSRALRISVYHRVAVRIKVCLAHFAKLRPDAVAMRSRCFSSSKLSRTCSVRARTFDLGNVGRPRLASLSAITKFRYDSRPNSSRRRIDRWQFQDSPILGPTAVDVVLPCIAARRLGMARNVEYLDLAFPDGLALKFLFHWCTSAM